MVNEDSKFSYDPFSPAVMANPLPFYKILRDRYPVYYIERYDTFVFSRFEDALDILSRRDNVFVASDTTLPSPGDLERHNNGRLAELTFDPLPMNPLLPSPYYEDVRQAFIKPLRLKSVTAMADFIRSCTIERLDALLPRTCFDLTRDYAGEVSARVVCKLFGLPVTRAREVLDVVNAGTATDPERGGVDPVKGAESTMALILPAVRARRAAGADGEIPLIDGMMDFRINGRALADEEIALQLLPVFIGGTETTPKIAAHGLMELAHHPDQLKAVRVDLATNVPIAVEEAIRYCAPAQWFLRTAHKETLVAGQRIGIGQRVLVLYGSAARDEREFENPDEFIWNRRIPRTLAFGFGQHFCVGVHVARLELRILLEEFLRRVSAYRVDMARAVRLPSSFQWGWNSLPVTIEEAAPPGSRVMP
jgi:cytochrome P450